VKVILSSGAGYVANPETDKVILVWESALLEITLSNLTLLTPAPTEIDKVNFAYETASGWSVDHPLKFTASQTVSAIPKVYIPFIPDDGVKAGGTILVSVYDGTDCWDYTATSSSGKTHEKGFRYKLTAGTWTLYAGFVAGNTKWATANVGASSETDYGYFFQWGNNQAWSGTGNSPASINPSGLPWSSTAYLPGLDVSWNSGKGPCPSGWRLPTKDEFTALTSLFTKGWKPNYNSSSINGYEFTDASGNTLFLPAAGQRSGSNGSLSVQTFGGYYWSATPDGSEDNAAWGLGTDSNNPPSVGYPPRATGQSVRCVQD
jgi:uncharacterized protein (TIGR02145 family)